MLINRVSVGLLWIKSTKMSRKRDEWEWRMTGLFGEYVGSFSSERLSHDIMINIMSTKVCSNVGLRYVLVY